MAKKQTTVFRHWVLVATGSDLLETGRNKISPMITQVTELGA